MSHKSNACSFIHEWSHGGSFAKKKSVGFVFCFFFFLYRLQHGPGCSLCVWETSPSFIHLFISCYSTSDARQRLVRVELDVIPATDALTGPNCCRVTGKTHGLLEVYGPCTRITCKFVKRFHILWGFPSGSHSEESACNTGDAGSTPGLGRSPGEGDGNPLQYSCLENSMDKGGCQATVCGVTKS